MVRLEDVKMFVRSTALGSFSNAAREAGLLPAQVSAAIQRLEKALGVRLFVRSTRSLRLTSQGEKYLPYAQEMLEVMKSGFDSLQSEDDGLHGNLKISLPSDLGRNVLLPLISRFCRDNSGVSVQLLFSDEVSNIYRDPVDIAIRYGELQNGSYVALPLAAHNRRVLVASPKYLQQYGRLERLEDLHQHECILWQKDGQIHNSWHFETSGSKKTLMVNGRYVSNDADVSRRWAVAGYGIAYKSRLDVYEDISSGKLVTLLQDIQGEKAPLNFICPHRSQFSALVRQVYSVLKDYLDGLDTANKA
ncbi:LysR family transcriptional regulator [Salmonella enterica subsp. enterica serovar Choleraesuis]|nr:LysR family transcriptional regulator [Salmonella enterica subsp. enterica serovar Choleraesuis]